MRSVFKVQFPKTGQCFVIKLPTRLNRCERLLRLKQLQQAIPRPDLGALRKSTGILDPRQSFVVVQQFFHTAFVGNLDFVILRHRLLHLLQVHFETLGSLARYNSVWRPAYGCLCAGLGPR